MERAICSFIRRVTETTPCTGRFCVRQGSIRMWWTYLKNQALGNTYSNYAGDIEEKIKNIGSSGGSSGSGSGAANDRDEYFEEAARFIIDKDKASIGMLQRVLKIGFNRAARIMDQLCRRRRGR